MHADWEFALSACMLIGGSPGGGVRMRRVLRGASESVVSVLAVSCTVDATADVCDRAANTLYFIICN